MRTFHVTVRTGGDPTKYTAIARSSAEAYDQAAERFADQPCSITVIVRSR